MEGLISMAMPKKGTRSITVDGVKYRWLLRKRPDYPPTLAVVVVEQDGIGGSVAVLETPYLEFDPWLHLDRSQRPSPTLETISPADVEGYIRTAMQAGWKPEAPGPAFTLKISEQQSGLPSKG